MRQDAAKIDAAYGHRFLKALHKERASRKAQQLSLAERAFDMALAKDAIRSRLEQKHATSDTAALKRANAV